MSALTLLLGCAPKGESSSPPVSAAPVAAADEITAPKEPFAADVEELWGLMQGSFSSRAQAQADPEYFDIRLHMMPIWTDREDARWLYVEQAVAVAPAEPYRQRVYQVAAGEDGTIVSAVYTIDEPLRFALAWQDPTKLDALTVDDVARKDGCEVVLRKQSEGTYAGSTGERSCPSDLRGASFATSEVVISEQGVDSWDRGYDDEGQQVWGAEKGGYAFRHDDPNAAPVESEKLSSR
ncbi:MAG: chromophore lyase CpcT/CpeT [Nannocystaceae bacterium]